MKWNVQVNVLHNNCKQNITSLSLLAGTTVKDLFNRLLQDHNNAGPKLIWVTIPYKEVVIY